MSTTIDKFRVVGLCAAPYTPFCENPARDVDVESIPAHVEALISRGVLAAFVCGTTGEGVTMSVAERKVVLEAWVKHSAGRLTVIASVGSESISDMIELSKHAVSSGAAAVS
jgi:N-acetylneuraminate lyase